jgi:hypothetical protein
MHAPAHSSHGRLQSSTFSASATNVIAPAAVSDA